ncbi:hypothetical protein AKJ09_03703 [Labilithrix luteola]|uniref:Uncharacterized protein n=1 Tax=Labilithrix luteola TaxID=1391654 RepID=A0A0K1PV85_9BACT|nr:hypothetical protein [Labilithrix luteola]AKU97039.1 hypothetical protein AKJ09_03703 [Labilithrix luteola]
MRHSMRWLAAGLAWALMTTACGPSKTTVDVKTRVAVTVTPTVDKLPFDPRGARITAAAQQLAEAAGHFIAIDVDAAIVPEFRSSFEEALGQSFENMIRDLASLKKRSEPAFAYGAPLVERVSLRYDVTATKDVVSLDAPSRTLVIRGPARREALVAEGTLYRALDDAFAAYVTQRFAKDSADSVAASDRRAYFDYLTGNGGGRSSFRDGKLETASDLANAPRAARIVSVVRLNELVTSDAALAKDTWRWLLSQNSWFTEQYTHRASLVRALPADCTFKRAETAYTRWLAAAFAKADDDQRLSIERSLFVRSFNQERAEQGGKSYPPFAWPGIDRFAFGLRVIDDWRAAGHLTQMTRGSSGKRSLAHEFVACPYAMDGTAHVVPHCDYDWYRFALESDDGPKRLASAMMERNDPIFTETVFHNIRHVASKSQDATIAMLRNVERNASAWLPGARVLAEASDNSTDRILLEEAQRLWLEHAEYRGTILYLLGHIDAYDHGNVDWRGFEDAFGGRVNASELQSYLDLGPTALWLLPIVWPALDKGYSRAALIVPKLDAMLDDGRLGSIPANGSYEALLHIIQHLCAEKNVADLATIRTYLKQRVASHPGEPFGRLEKDATSESCQPAPPPPPPRNEVRLVPGKQRLKIIQKGTP